MSNISTQNGHLDIAFKELAENGPPDSMWDVALLEEDNAVARQKGFNTICFTENRHTEAHDEVML